MSSSSHIVYVESPDQNSRGTGAFVGPDLVLTALHVIWPKYESVDPPREPVRVRVGASEQPNATLHWPTIDSVRNHTVDAALVKLDDKGPPHRDKFLELDDGWPIDAEFRSEGFPASISIGKATIRGKLCDHGADPQLGRLSCTEGHLPNGATGWQGVSGGPVVVAGRIRGVLKSLDRNWANVLDATKTRAIRSAPGFAALRLAPNPFEGLLETVLLKIVGFRSKLQKFAGLESDARLIPWMLSPPCDEVLATLNRMHEAVCGDFGNESAKAEAQVLKALVLSVFAAHAPSGEIHETGIRILDVVSSSSAAAAQAKRHGLPVQLAMPSKGRDHPPGLGRLPSPPDNEFGENFHKSIRNHLGKIAELSDPTDEVIRVFLAAVIRDARRNPHTVVMPYLEVDKDPRDDRSLETTLASLLSKLPELDVFARNSRDSAGRARAAEFEIPAMFSVNAVLIRHAKTFPA